MPAYTITAGYSSPAPLSPTAHRAVGAAVEAAAVAQLRLSAGVGEVPPAVADALALLRAWHGGERVRVHIAHAVPPGVIVAHGGEQPAMITNVGE